MVQFVTDSSTLDAGGRQTVIRILPAGVHDEAMKRIGFRKGYALLANAPSRDTFLKNVIYLL